MKFTKEMQDRIIAWVELNGLYPQPCGATLSELCKSCGITWDTFKKWEQNSDFSERLTHAREKFASTVEVDIVNALVKAAKGVDFTKEKQEYKAQVIKEYDKDTGKKVKEYLGEKPVQVRATSESFYYPPDVKAAQFVLTNMAPERWKMKQEQTIVAPEGVKFIVENEEQKRIVENLGKEG